MTAHAHTRLQRLPLLCGIMFLLGYPVCHVQAMTEGDYTYITNGAGQATITGFNSYYHGALSITNMLGGCTVTAIESDAFMFCNYITAFTIPASIISIDVEPFYWGGGPTMTNITR